MHLYLIQCGIYFIFNYVRLKLRALKINSIGGNHIFSHKQIFIKYIFLSLAQNLIKSCGYMVFNFPHPNLLKLDYLFWYYIFLVINFPSPTPLNCVKKD